MNCAVALAVLLFGNEVNTQLSSPLLKNFNTKTIYTISSQEELIKNRIRTFTTFDTSKFSPRIDELKPSLLPTLTQSQNVAQLTKVTQLPNWSQAPNVAQMPNLSQLSNWAQLLNLPQLPNWSQIPNVAQLPKVYKVPEINLPETQWQQPKYLPNANSLSYVNRVPMLTSLPAILTIKPQEEKLLTPPKIQTAPTALQTLLKLAGSNAPRKDPGSYNREEVWSNLKALQDKAAQYLI